MMIYMNLICIIMFVIGNIIFTLKYKYLLITLLSLEFIILSLYFFMLVVFSSGSYDLYLLMSFLVFSVCEGVLGLSILVSIIRSFGNDYFQSFNLL